MKTQQSNSQIWVDGHLVEIDLDTVTTEELVVTPHLLDGFHPCAACEDVLVLAEKKYCRFCQMMHDELEPRSPQQERIDMGVVDMGAVPYEALEMEPPPSPVAIGIILLGALCSAMFLLTGLWYVGRGLVGICLEHTK